MTFEEFAKRLADRIPAKLSFDDAAALMTDAFADVGPVPRDGDATLAITKVAAAFAQAHDPFQLGRLLLFAGYLVERGAPPGEAAAMLPGRLARLMSLAATAVRAAAGERDALRVARISAANHPSAASALLAIDMAVPGAMTLLVRDRQALRAVRLDASLPGDTRLVSAFTPLADFLAELLDSSDQLATIVLWPWLRSGVEVVADGVRNGFHLFSLLESTLIGTSLGGKPVPAEETAIARGEAMPGRDVIFKARFDYFNWSAWDGSSFVADAPTRWIWGELPLRSVPRAHGSPVVLMNPPLYVRTWNASLVSRVHPDARSEVRVVRMLGTSGFIDWSGRIAAAPASAREQMRYAGVAV